MNEKPLCIYHHGCTDGFAAAWAVRKHYGDGEVEFHPGIYGEAPPDVTGRVVILVDFSYKRPVLVAMVEQAACGREPASVAGRLVQGQQSLGEVAVVLPDAPRRPDDPAE